MAWYDYHEDLTDLVEYESSAFIDDLGATSRSKEPERSWGRIPSRSGADGMPPVTEGWWEAVLNG